MVLYLLAFDNFDFTRKIVKKILGEKLVKMVGFFFKMEFLDKNLTFRIVCRVRQSEMNDLIVPLGTRCQWHVRGRIDTFFFIRLLTMPPDTYTGWPN